MLSLIFFFTSILILSVIVNMFFAISTQEEQEEGENSPLESGFSTVGRPQTTFSLQYLIILLLFLIFDLEIVFVVALSYSHNISEIINLIFFLFITTTLWIEWNWGNLNWVVFKVSVWTCLFVVQENLL